MALSFVNRDHFNAIFVKKKIATIYFKFLWALLTKGRSNLNAIFVKRILISNFVVRWNLSFVNRDHFNAIFVMISFTII